MTHVLWFLFTDKDTEPEMGRENRTKVVDLANKQWVTLSEGKAYSTFVSLGLVVTELN